MVTTTGNYATNTGKHVCNMILVVPK